MSFKPSFLIVWKSTDATTTKLSAIDSLCGECGYGHVMFVDYLRGWPCVRTCVRVRVRVRGCGLEARTLLTTTQPSTRIAAR